MSGLVGIIAQETARYSFFSESLSALRLPERASVKWWFGHDIADNANALVREMYAQERDWLWLLGDDHVFSADLLERLLGHGFDIVAPLCLMRNPPYEPVVFTGWAKWPLRRRIDLDEHEGGVIEVHSVGSGGLLVRRPVFDAIEEPWFEAGVNSTVHIGEDLYFCDKARAQGYTIYCDLDAHLGHCTVATVWPVKEQDGWTHGFSMVGGYQITVPPKLKAAA